MGESEMTRGKYMYHTVTGCDLWMELSSSDVDAAASVLRCRASMAASKSCALKL
ncbi:hypothetical protein PC114_g17224 [Phytophthora cactorum]|nr:hypothetical protein PC114_g17224 [Phytophthora cactorum]